MKLKLNNNQSLEIDGTTISDNFKLKCTDLFVKDCPNINQINLLKAILNTSDNTLSRVRVNANNDVFTLSQVRQLLNMSGFNDSMQEQVKPRIVGSITINDYLTQEILTQLQNTLDGCTITAPNLINWNEVAVQTLDSEKPNYNPAVAIVLNNNGKGTVTGSPIIEGGGRYFLTKTQAAAITGTFPNSWFTTKTTITDTNHIIDGRTYDFNNFDEFQYFGCTALQNQSFRICTKLQSIIFNNIITNTGSTTFFNCTVLKLKNLPSSITIINNDSFRYVGSNATISSDELIDVNLPSLITLGSYAFADCPCIKNVVNLGVITSIASGVFSNTNLEFCEIPSTVTSIEALAFYNCANLQSIVWGTNLTTIKDSAFKGCNKLNIGTLPTSITTIGRQSFETCGTNLTYTESDYVTINLPNLQTLGISAFNYCKCIKRIEDLGSITGIASTAFAGLSNLEFCEIPSTVTSIEALAFYDTTGIIHFMSEIPCTLSTNNNFNRVSKLYVGDGSSQAHDDSILAAYLADTNWATYSSKLDTWYNYLQSQNS